MEQLRNKIQDNLKLLIGLRLSIARRAADMRIFQFGQVRKVENSTVGEYALHIQCPWRIEDPHGIVTGRSDLWEPAENEEGVDWQEWDYDKSENLQDKLIGKLLKGYDKQTRSHINEIGMLVVEGVKADRFGGAEIYLSGGYRIAIFPDGAKGEHWRLFRPQTGEEHFVVKGAIESV